ncbi:MAG: GlmL-related ornithine degradation protein [Anaerovoracaceae bacterium]|jgi:uncharacterized protein (TIGR01319 family)
MKADVLVAEIGSTTTVVNAFTGIKSGDPLFWGQGQAPTSVLDGDVRVGLNGAIEDLCRNKGIDSLEYDEMLATSSAAGGLAMTVHGLVWDMTSRVAREAALGAGAIVHQVTAGKLRNRDIERIREVAPKLILLAGGVDGGEKDTVIYNAMQLAGSGVKTPVIYGGNAEAAEEVKKILSDRDVYVVENVFPEIGKLNIEPCREIIQDAYEEHITNAPGMEHVRDLVNGPIIPTPGAVMECTRLLNSCIGNVMVLDCGGATTDVHSVTEDSEEMKKLIQNPEPKAKRTVEGDLGVYVNRYNVIDSIGRKRLREDLPGVDIEAVLDSYEAIPKTEDEFKLVERLALECVIKAVERHAGTVRYLEGKSGTLTIAEGKDLTQVEYIVGTGGAMTRLPHRVEIMRKIPEYNRRGLRMFPDEEVKILVDNDYIMASLGVLSREYRDAAVKLLEKSLHFPLTGDQGEKK